MLKTMMIALVAATAVMTHTVDTRAAQDPGDVVRRFFDAYRALDADRLVSLMAPAIQFEDPTMRLSATGQAEMRKMADGVKAAYKDIAIEVHSMVASGDDVATEVTISGTLSRPDGTTRKIRVRGASFFRVRNGLIEKWTDYFDARTFTEQTQ